MGYGQIVIARKDLNMSDGKFASQCCHASMAFLTTEIRKNSSRSLKHKYVYHVYKPNGNPQTYLRNDLYEWAQEARDRGEKVFYARPVDPKNPCGKLELIDRSEIEYDYKTEFKIDKETYEQWIDSAFTKTICQAKNKNQLLKAAKIAESLGLEEGTDFFLVKDNCCTELEPEEIDENGIGRTLTAIGFRPLDDETAHKISKKFHLYM